MLPCKDCLPAQETLVQALGREDPLEEMSAHSTLLAWEIPFTEELGGLRSTGLQRDMTERLRTQALRVDSFASEPPGEPFLVSGSGQKAAFLPLGEAGWCQRCPPGPGWGAVWVCVLSTPPPHPVIRRQLVRTY